MMKEKKKVVCFWGVSENILPSVRVDVITGANKYERRNLDLNKKNLCH